MANLYARSLGYKVEITQKIWKKDKEIHILEARRPRVIALQNCSQLTSFARELSTMTSPEGQSSPNSNRGSSELKRSFCDTGT